MTMKKTMLAAAMIATALTGCSVFKGKGGPKTPTVGTRVSILGSANEIAVDPEIAAQQVVLPPETANSGWTQSGGSADKAMGHLALPAALSTAWTAQIAGNTKSAKLAASPVVDNGRLYVIDVNATVHAFDAKTGVKIWSTSIASGGSDGRKSLFGGGVSVEGDKVYATNGVGDVAALSTSNGGVAWQKRPAGPLRGAPTIFAGQIFVMTQDNQLIALRATDGDTEWQEIASVEAGSVFGVAAPAAGQGTVVAGFSSGELNAYRYENGRNLWSDALSRTSISTSVSTLVDVDADPVIDRGRVFAVGQGGRMAAYELLTGQRAWELNIAGISTPWVAGEWVFVVTDDARVLCVSRATGKIRWISQLAHYRDEKDKKDPIRWTGPVLAGNRLFLVSSNGAMAQLNPGDGSVTSQTDMKVGSTLSPIVADGMLYVLDDSGRISAWR